MNADAPGDLAPRPCRVQDMAALIGLLAVIEGEIMAGEIPAHLNHRVRYALGEYDEQPPRLRVPEQRPR